MIENAMIDEEQDRERPEGRVGVQDVLDALRTRCLRAGARVGRSGRTVPAGRWSFAIGGLRWAAADSRAEVVDAPGRAEEARQPQQFSRPNVVSLDSTPVCGWSVISVTPVSTKSLPSVGSGLVPSLAYAAIGLARPSRPSSAGTAARSRR